MEKRLQCACHLHTWYLSTLWCPYCFFGNLNFSDNKQVGDKNARILILDVNIDDVRYVLVNIYKANTEAEQVQVLSELSELMEKKFFGRKPYSCSW